jgi:hypothetical protein
MALPYIRKLKVMHYDIQGRHSKTDLCRKRKYELTLEGYITLEWVWKMVLSVRKT